MIAWFGFLLAFVAGFVDTATFVGARGVFSAHVTGNFVLFAVALTQGLREIDYLKLFLFIPFLLAIAFVSQLNRVKSIQARLEPYMLMLSAVLLVIPAVYFFGVSRLKDELWDMSNLLIMFPVFAMGIQNGLYKIKTPTEAMTTVMTGNVTQFVLEIMKERSAKAFAIFKLIIGFAIGCLAAAWMVTQHSLGALLLPAVILMALSFYRFRTTEESL